jgi:hypothetical protein
MLLLGPYQIKTILDNILIDLVSNLSVPSYDRMHKRFNYVIQRDLNTLCEISLSHRAFVRTIVVN